MPEDLLRPRLEQVFQFAGQQLRRLIEQHPDAFPMVTGAENGSWTAKSWTNWCEGFLGGQLWLLFEHTGDRLLARKSRTLQPPDRTAQK